MIFRWRGTRRRGCSRSARVSGESGRAGCLRRGIRGERGDRADSSFNAPQLDFGNQLVGSPNPPQIGILTNAGTAALTVSGIAITGANASDFSQSNDCPLSPATLAPQATCQLTVNFAPSIPGAESAAISFTDDAVGSPQSINLTGAGQEPVPPLSLPLQLILAISPPGPSAIRRRYR